MQLIGSSGEIESRAAARDPRSGLNRKSAKTRSGLRLPMRKTLLHRQTNNFGITVPAICEQVVLMHGLKYFLILKD
jgi:hypothetical protein